MSMPGPTAPPPAPAGSSYLDQLTKAAAVLGALIAVGQASTSWITGYWTSQAELQKKEKEIQLSELKARSDLAESYIKLIIAKDTSQPYQVLLMGALSELKDHPLQAWAKTQFAEMQASLAAFNRAQTARSEAFKFKTETERRQAELQGEIAALTAEREIYRTDTGRSNQIQQTILIKLTELQKLEATLRIATKVDTEIVVVAATPAQNAATPPIVSAAIGAIERKVTAQLLMTVFPASAQSNVQADVKHLAAAMKEARIADPRVAAVIIATILVETPQFNHYEEPQASFNTKEQPFDAYEKDSRLGRVLGNSEPGDGAKYKGRGYIGLTGRANYARTGARLNLDLVNNPDLAKQPEVAARVICAYFAERLPSITEALDRNDLAYIRRVVAGGSRQLEQFTAGYNKLLAQLNAP